MLKAITVNAPVGEKTMAPDKDTSLDFDFHFKHSKIKIKRDEDGFPELPEWFDDPISPYSITIGDSQNYGHGQVVPYFYIELDEGELIDKTTIEREYASLLERNSRRQHHKNIKPSELGFSALEEDS